MNTLVGQRPNYLRAALLGCAIGVASACLLDLFTHTLSDGNIDVRVLFNQLRLLVWPSSILQMADPANTLVGIKVVSIAFNGVLYGVAAMLIEMARRRRGVTWLPSAILFGSWICGVFWLYSL
jgi:hypothetical protein